MGQTILTRDAAMQMFGYKSLSTFYARRAECLTSPFSKAVILDSQRHTLIDADLWKKYLEWRDKQNKIKKFGLEAIKDKRALENF